ncbi:MAG: hypothetical protein ILP10_06525 [Lachnospiraceae bacterium]|nr:hypothetical protein [Lachnospiraceae bacterium]
MLSDIARRTINESGSVRICIDSYDSGNMSGRIYEGYSEEPVAFSNVVALLKQLDVIYDSSDYPQASMRQRSFGSKKSKDNQTVREHVEKELVKPTAIMTNVRGKIATFRVKVMFRQNASWQGNVTWVEKGIEESFRSALELIMLMDSSFAKESRAEKTGSDTEFFAQAR